MSVTHATVHETRTHVAKDYEELLNASRFSVRELPILQPGE